MMYKEISTKKLVEHPENKKLFKDIEETNPGFWIEFVDSIKTLGIIEPLIVNAETMQVRSGNQRLKAAVEIGLEVVPVLLVDPEEDTDEEIRKMIASNVYRRTIDPFSMFEYIGRLRGKSDPGQKNKAITDVASEVHKKHTFVSAADIFNGLEKEQQEALNEWFREKEEGKKAKTEGELIAMVKAIEADNTALEQELRGVNDEAKETNERIKELQEMIDERDEKIEEILNTDYEEERELSDRTINELLDGQKKLRNKIKELKEAPDINFYLIECVKRQKEINGVLKEIVANVDSLNEAKLAEFMKALKSTFSIIEKGTKNNDREDRMEIIDERKRN